MEFKNMISISLMMKYNHIPLLGTRPTLLTNYVISHKMPFLYNERTAITLI